MSCMCAPAIYSKFHSSPEEPKWFSGLITLFLLVAQGLSPWGTLTNFCIVHYEFITPLVSNKCRTSTAILQANKQTHKQAQKMSLWPMFFQDSCIIPQKLAWPTNLTQPVQWMAGDRIMNDACQDTWWNMEFMGVSAICTWKNRY